MKLIFFSFFASFLIVGSAVATPTMDGNVYVFLSFSMPKGVLKSWLFEASLYHVPVYIRGLYNNSFKETISKMSALQLKSNEGILLDPTLFQKFGITKVPAVVVAKNENCPLNVTCTNPFDVIYGNTTLQYALNKIADSNDDVSSIARFILQKHDEKAHA